MSLIRGFQALPTSVAAVLGAIGVFAPLMAFLAMVGLSDEAILLEMKLVAGLLLLLGVGWYLRYLRQPRTTGQPVRRPQNVLLFLLLVVFMFAISGFFCWWVAGTLVGFAALSLFILGHPSDPSVLFLLFLLGLALLYSRRSRSGSPGPKA